MTRTVFNENNTGHLTKSYPMFLGDSLGINDTVNTVNKKVAELVELQRSLNWHPTTEVNLTQDRMDMLNSSKDVVELMTLTIGWQSMQDSIAGRSIGALLLPHVTNPEAETLISEWNRMECVHSQSYQHIVKQVMPNPDLALIDIYKNKRQLERSSKIIEVFNSLYNMPHDTPAREKKKIIAKVLATIMAMECISFMSSFAVTFAIAETNKFQGVGEIVRLICRD